MQINEQFKIKMEKLLGETSCDFFASLEKPTIKGITLNTTRTSSSEWKTLIDFDNKPVPEVDNGLIVDNLKVGTHILNHLGIIYSQEPSAMYPVQMLDIEEGEVVLDLCSAPGGKSIQILEKLNGKGLLVSNEIVYNRAKILYENINRMGFKNFAITCNSPQDFASTGLKFDKILVDAPCGGEGMFRRHDFDFDAYNNSSIETNAKRQQSILESIKNLLKPNGKLVYSTCTYDIRENEEVVANFLKNNPDFELIDYPRLNNVTTQGIDIPPFNTNQCKRRYPHIFEGEGQFMALLRKKGEKEESICQNFYAKGFENIYKKDIEILRNTFKDVANIKDLEIVKRNDNFYVLPDTQLDFEDLNILTIGTVLGTLSKGNFKLSHEFYHTYNELFFNQIELNDSQIFDYLKGYEIDIDTTSKGICSVTYKGIGLGGGKIANSKLKNYYPKNLRNN